MNEELLEEYCIENGCHLHSMNGETFVVDVVENDLMYSEVHLIADVLEDEDVNQ